MGESTVLTVLPPAALILDLGRTRHLRIGPAAWRGQLPRAVFQWPPLFCFPYLTGSAQPFGH